MLHYTDSIRCRVNDAARLALDESLRNQDALATVRVEGTDWAICLRASTCRSSVTYRWLGGEPRPSYCGLPSPVLR